MIYAILGSGAVHGGCVAAWSHSERAIIGATTVADSARLRARDPLHPACRPQAA